MNQLTFIDKINVLFNMLFSSPIIIGIFAFSMVLMILLFFYSRINKKLIKIVFIILYVGLIGFAVVKYGKYFLSSIDSFLTLFMANIYFPIIPVYIVIMFISFIIMVVTLSSKSNHKIVKIINTVFFTFIQMLFALFIYIVESSKIDVSSNSNLYSNEQTMTLLELGMGLFVIWIFVLLIIFYLKKADKIFKVKKIEESNDFDAYINDYINTVFFTFIQMLFALFIYIVESSKIDVSSNSNLYSNEQTMTLLELGMGLFVIWIFVLLIIFYLKKADKIFKVKKIEESNDFDAYINDYNEPKDVPIENNGFSFNNSVVQNLVPGINVPNAEVLSFDDVNNSINQSNDLSSAQNFNNQNVESNLNDISISSFGQQSFGNTLGNDLYNQESIDNSLNSFDNQNSLSFDTSVDSVSFNDTSVNDINVNDTNVNNTSVNNTNVNDTNINNMSVFNNFEFLDNKDNKSINSDEVEIVDFEL